MNYEFLIRAVDRLKNTEDTQNLQEEFTDIILAIGFQQFAYMRFDMDTINGEQSIYTYSESWKIIYFKRKYGLIDPVFARAFAENEPFYWSSKQYTDNEKLIDFFSEASKYGIDQGVTAPLKAMERKKAILTCACAHKDEEDVLGFHDHKLVIVVQTLAEVFHQMAIVFNDIYDHHLKPREQQVLKLSALGMETHKIATFLELNKDYVHEVIANALRRLGTNNRVAAVHRSKELGFLDLKQD